MDFVNDYLQSKLLQTFFITKLGMIEKEHPTAATQHKTECCRSGVCCWRRPGELSPEDVPKIAAFLGVSPQELFQRFLVVDEIRDYTSLLPRRAHQVDEAGTKIGWRETYSLESPCVFLDKEHSCTIHEVKPAGCRDFKCWVEIISPEDIPHYKWSEDKLLELGWDGVDTE